MCSECPAATETTLLIEEARGTAQFVPWRGKYQETGRVVMPKWRKMKPKIVHALARTWFGNAQVDIVSASETFIKTERYAGATGRPAQRAYGDNRHWPERRRIVAQLRNRRISCAVPDDASMLSLARSRCADQPTGIRVGVVESGYCATIGGCSC